MPIIRQSSNFLGNAGRAAAAFDQTTDGVRETEVRLKAHRDRMEIAELERMRRIQQESTRREFDERRFAWQKSQADIGQSIRREELDLRQQQQDRLDSQEYGANLDTGPMPVVGSSVASMRQRLEALNPGLAAQFDEQFHTMSAGEFEGAEMGAGVYDDPRYLRRAYKTVTGLLGQAENIADATAQRDMPMDVLGAVEQFDPQFLQTPKGAEFAEAVAGFYGAEDYELNAGEAQRAAARLRREGLRLAGTEQARERYKAEVLGWVTDPDAMKGEVPPEWEEEKWELLDELGSTDNPRAVRDKIEERINPVARRAALRAREEERARLAQEAMIRQARDAARFEEWAASSGYDLKDPERAEAAMSLWPRARAAMDAASPDTVEADGKALKDALMRFTPRFMQDPKGFGDRDGDPLVGPQVAENKHTADRNAAEKPEDAKYVEWVLGKGVDLTKIDFENLSEEDAKRLEELEREYEEAMKRKRERRRNAALMGPWG